MDRYLGLTLASVLLIASGCGWAVVDHLPDLPVRPGTPPAFYRLDIEASTVEYVGNNTPTDAEALEVRNAVAEILETRAYAVAHDRASAPPARFKAVVQVRRVVWPQSWTIACVDLQVVGCPTGSADVTAQLELQVGNDLYVGRGSGSGVGGLYYNKYSGTPKALAQAIESAVETLTLVGSVGAAPSSGPLNDS
jgi:hypothetical protein